MKILNIHGYQGEPQNSAFTALREAGYDNIVSPSIDYDAVTPNSVIESLKFIVSQKKPDIITGTSLGGFFAAVLSAETGLPAILINPCLMPFYHLPELDYKGDITQFIALFGLLQKLDRDKVSCIIGGSDEVINTHSFTENFLKNERFRIVPEGKHSGSTLPLKEYFGEVLELYK
ncbi:MAG: hypothetical protein IK097_07635 [Clostridia bacterium]|nr:hypothetical protein [Clostridia bacterium]